MKFTKIIANFGNILYKNKVLLTNVLVGVGLLSYGSLTVYDSLDISSNKEYSYLYRVQLEPILDNSNAVASKSVNIEDKVVDWNDPTVFSGLVRKNRDKFNEFFKQNSNKATYVNVEEKALSNESQDDLNFFIHQKSSERVLNKNIEWLSLVNLNQLSVDRYGHEFDEKGDVKSDNKAKVHQIIDWKDIDSKSFKLIKEKSGDSYISFNFFNKDVSADEIKIISNKEENKYKNTDGLPNKWFIWMDKDLLALRLNYVFHTWLFQQTSFQSNAIYKDLVGESGSRTEEHKKRFEILEANYKKLTKNEVDFASDYYSTFWNNDSDINKDQVLTENLIKTDDLNKIYHKFESAKKPLDIFNKNLLSTFAPGEDKVLEEYLGLVPSGETADDKKAAKTKLTKKDKGVAGDAIKFSLDTKNNLEWDYDRLLNSLVYYSIKEFRLKSISKDSDNKTQYFWPSAEYSNTYKHKFFETIHVNEVTKTLKSFENVTMPALFAILFLIICGSIITSLYRVPGLISFGALFFSIVSTLALAILSSFKLSENVFCALLLMFLFGLVQVIYYLNTFQKELMRFKLAKSAIIKANKKAMVFIFDSSLCLFIFSSLFSFLAPVHIRDFSIVLSIGVLVNFFLLPLFMCLNNGSFINRHYMHEHLYLVEREGNQTITFFDKAVNKCILSNIRTYSLYAIAIIFSGLMVWYLNMRFNSDLIYQENYLITLDLSKDAFSSGTKKTAFDLITTLPNAGLQKINGSESDPNIVTYITTSGSPLETIKDAITKTFTSGSYSIQETLSYSEIDTFYRVLSILKWIYLIVCVYFLLRFGIIYAIILFTTASLSSLIYLSVNLLARIYINHLFNISLISMQLMLIIFMLMLASELKDDYKKDFFYDSITVKDKFRLIYLKYRKAMFLDFLLSLMMVAAAIITYKYDVFMFVCQTFIAKALVGLVVCPLFIAGWEIMIVTKTKLFSALVETKNSQKIMERLFTYDTHDEEIIEGINKPLHN